MTSTSLAPVVELVDVSKRYGNSVVLSGLDLRLIPGEAIGLVGENGAGKSTTVGILSGNTGHSSGTLRVDGVERSFRSPRDARALGITVIPQELAYVPELTVAENIVLANWPKGRVLSRASAQQREARRILDDLHIDLDVRRPMKDLSLADRQIVEIAKSLTGKARVLILDEPTASLHASETAVLLERLAGLKRDGVSLVYVSHHLDETLEISDRIITLRNGRLVDDSAAADTTLDRTVSLMLGPGHQRREAHDATPVDISSAMHLDGWTATSQPALTDFSMDIRTGEVLGLFGLVGSGAETVARGLGGHEKRVRGSIAQGGSAHRAPRSPREAERLGIAYVPAERKTDGLALEQSIQENITISTAPSYTVGHTWVRSSARRRLSTSLVEEFDVRCRGVDQPVGELSGGNQQKVLLASRMAAKPPILVLHEPTRGVDIGSRDEIHGMLRDYARGGHAVVLVTSDLQEAVDATDRILILRDGRFVAELAGDQKNTTTTLAIAAGASHD